MDVLLWLLGLSQVAFRSRLAGRERAQGTWLSSLVTIRPVDLVTSCLVDITSVDVYASCLVDIMPCEAFAMKSLCL